MNVIYDIIEKIEKASEELIKEAQLLRKHNKEYDFERLMLDGKRGARISSDLFLAYRQILLSLCSFSTAVKYSTGSLYSTNSFSSFLTVTF